MENNFNRTNVQTNIVRTFVQEVEFTSRSVNQKYLFYATILYRLLFFTVKYILSFHKIT